MTQANGFLPDSERRLLPGCMLWALFCLAIVIARGVRWDEDFEFAQVFLRQVALPDGHPVLRYVRNAFSLQTYSTAALLWATKDSLTVCGLRNFLFMAATVLPVFLMGVTLGRRIIWGNFAVLFVLFGLHIEFDGSYPQFIWPDQFSNGHIGTGYALLTVFLLLTERRVAGYFLMGMMPCIHIGQWPPVLALGALMLLNDVVRGRREQVMRGLFGLAGGAAICVWFAVLQRPFRIAAPVAGAFQAVGNPDDVLRPYLAYHDLHRSIPLPSNCHLALAGLLVACGVMAWLRRGTDDGHRWAWLTVYAGFLGAIAWGIMLAQLVMKEDTPLILIRWMPYRLFNHAPPLLIAVLCGAAGTLGGNSKKEQGAIWLITALLVWCMVNPLATKVISPEICERYLVPHAGLLFVFTGIVFSLVVSSQDVRWRRRALFFVSLVLFSALMVFHRFGAACFVLGWVGAHMVGFFAQWPPLSGKVPEPFRAARWLCVSCLFLIMLDQAVQHRCLPVGPFERRVHQKVPVESSEKDMILGPPFQLLLQAKTGQPVMTDMALPTWMPYMPEIAPIVERMYSDLYGISFREPTYADWKAVWAKRKPMEWTALGDAYGFRYVVCPEGIPLHLPVVLREGQETLYRVSGLGFRYEGG